MDPKRITDTLEQIVRSLRAGDGSRRPVGQEEDAGVEERAEIVVAVGAGEVRAVASGRGPQSSSDLVGDEPPAADELVVGEAAGGERGSHRFRELVGGVIRRPDTAKPGSPAEGDQAEADPEDEIETVGVVEGAPPDEPPVPPASEAEDEPAPELPADELAAEPAGSDSSEGDSVTAERVDQPSDEPGGGLEVARQGLLAEWEAILAPLVNTSPDAEAAIEAAIEPAAEADSSAAGVVVSPVDPAPEPAQPSDPEEELEPEPETGVPAFEHVVTAVPDGIPSSLAALTGADGPSADAEAGPSADEAGESSASIAPPPVFVESRAPSPPPAVAGAFPVNVASELAESLGLGYHLGSALERITQGSQQGRAGIPALREAIWFIERYAEVLERRPIGADLHASSEKLRSHGEVIAGLRALSQELERQNAIEAPRRLAGLTERAAPDVSVTGSQRAGDDLATKPAPVRRTVSEELMIMLVRTVMFVIGAALIVLIATLIGQAL